MFEDLKEIIDKEYDKIEVESNDLSSIANEIDKQIEEQNNNSMNNEIQNSTLVNNFLQEHNKSTMNDLTSEEIDELLKKIDIEIENME